ncbi:MAG: hypothetical protein FK731_01815, partial [Asgard group archaeon]|nr:hypothetical protein [Asgard group archaeon]
MNPQNRRLGEIEHTKFPEVPVLIYNPPGISNIKLITEAARIGALGILDLEFLSITAIENALTELDQLGIPFGIRVDPFSGSLTNFLSSDQPKGLKLVILPPKPTLQKLVRKEIYKRIHSLGVKVFQEVCDEKEIKNSSDANVDGLIPRGFEGGGRVSNQSTFILFQQ